MRMLRGCYEETASVEFRLNRCTTTIEFSFTVVSILLCIFSRASRTLRDATQVVTFLSVTKKISVSEAQSPTNHSPP